MLTREAGLSDASQWMDWLDGRDGLARGWSGSRKIIALMLLAIVTEQPCLFTLGHVPLKPGGARRGTTRTRARTLTRNADGRTTRPDSRSHIVARPGLRSTAPDPTWPAHAHTAMWSERGLPWWLSTLLRVSRQTRHHAIMLDTSVCTFSWLRASANLAESVQPPARSSSHAATEPSRAW